MSGQEPLRSVVAKLNRADKHLREVRELRDEFAASDFYESVTEVDYRGRPVERAKNVQRPDPEKFGPVIGDCVHNFRAALDHLAYELTACHTVPLTRRAARDSAFPIFNAGYKFKGQRGHQGARRALSGMSRTARAAIERVQPYHRRTHPELLALWWLESLSNVDKHRVDHLTAAVPMQGNVAVENIGTNTFFPPQQRIGPIKENTALVRLQGTFPAPEQVKVKSEITPDVAFDETCEVKSLRGVSVLNVLASFRDVIAFRVLPALDEELARCFPGWNLTVGVDDSPTPGG